MKKLFGLEYEIETIDDEYKYSTLIKCYPATELEQLDDISVMINNVIIQFETKIINISIYGG